jgi:hypothetical protein
MASMARPLVGHDFAVKKGRTAASLNYPLTQAGSQVTLESVARENN